MCRFLFQFIDLPSRTGGPGILGIAIPVVVAVAILLILIGEWGNIQFCKWFWLLRLIPSYFLGIFCYFGCFKRMTPEERAKQEGQEDTGFKEEQESAKMLSEEKWLQRFFDNQILTHLKPILYYI